MTRDREPARLEWDFALSAVIAPRPRRADVSDVLGAVEVDPSDPRLLATAGIARKIRVYDLDRCGASAAGCDFYICAPAKLSSLRWRPGSAGRVVGAGDYDGVVTEYDLERRVPVSERDEHGGRRVWSVDYSADGSLAASGADDGAAHVWDACCGAAVGLINVGAPVCSVEFEKERGVHVAVGCADKCAYVYDLRNMQAGPVAALAGHRKTVSYVRFAGGGRAVTSSVDGSHRMWDTSDGREVRSYEGHRNMRSFVGMGVCKGAGLIGSGSESNEVFVYDLRWADPIWVQGFGDGEEGAGEKGFVSAVCWREAGENECALIAGGSDGVVKIFAGKRKVEFMV